jgi:predicted phage-related endonuclease
MSESTIKYFPEMQQGSPEWFAARCGLLTASEMKEVLTPKTLEMKKGYMDHVYELLAQRISGFVEPSYISNDMLRGIEDEPLARAAFAKKWGGVSEVGFVTNNKWGYTLGCSPDWLVNEDEGAECKSRKQALQMKFIMTEEVPDDAMLQIQTNLLVSERKKWWYVSYSGGHRMKRTPVERSMKHFDAILTASSEVEKKLTELMAKYKDMIASDDGLLPTERTLTDEDVPEGEWE